MLAFDLEETYTSIMKEQEWLIIYVVGICHGLGSHAIGWLSEDEDPANSVDGNFDSEIYY